MKDMADLKTIIKQQDKKIALLEGRLSEFQDAVEEMNDE